MKNPEVFPGTNFQDILKEIHKHSANKRKSIKTLMDSLSLLIKRAQDAAIIVPSIRDLLDVSVKNDEHLVKIATIMQRLMSSEAVATGGSLDQLLTDDEKQELLAEAKELQEEEGLKAGKEAIQDLKLVLEEADGIQALEEKTKKTIDRVKKLK